MAKKETIVYTCDICENTIIPKSTKHEASKIQVIFTTEQIEGRSIKPYLTGLNNLDVCDSCMNHILDGNYVYGAGAMGYNKYYFKKA